MFQINLSNLKVCDKEISQEVEARFEEIVAKLMDKEGKDFLEALYEAHMKVEKELLEKLQIKVACKKGCMTASCCYQIVSCLPIEADHIMRFLKQHDFDYKTSKAMKQQAGRLSSCASRILEMSRGNRAIFLQDAYSRALEYRCLFLNAENKCLIYPVRPSICRGFRVSELCSEIERIIKSPLSMPKGIFLSVDGILNAELINSENELGHDTTDYFMISHLIPRGLLEIL